MNNRSESYLNSIAERFCIDGRVDSIKPVGNGHINDTYLVRTDRDEYILQRINTDVFTDPDALMENVTAVTRHLNGRLRYIPCRNGALYYNNSYRFKPGGEQAVGPELVCEQTVEYDLISEQTVESDLISEQAVGSDLIGGLKEESKQISTTSSECWRMMTCISNAFSCEKAESPEVFCEIGRAYGAFISALSDFPADSLHETIKGFHDTRKRFDNLMGAADADRVGRRKLVTEELAFACRRERYADLLGNMMASGALPVRVTHNDTKINNVMLERVHVTDTKISNVMLERDVCNCNDSDDLPHESVGHDLGDKKQNEYDDMNLSGHVKAVCVVDLDTVMPGLVVNDFGDAIRSGASTGREDERDVNSIKLDMEMYRSFERGFLEGFPDITPLEKEKLPAGAIVMTYECGIRFLTDYLDGDRYFKTDYPDHNLVRCRAQFKLLEDMENKFAEMQEIVNM